MIAASGVGMPALREARMPSHASSAAIRSSTAPTISAEAQSGTAVARPAIARGLECEQRQQCERCCDGDERGRLPLRPDLLGDLGLGELDLGPDDGRDVVAQPANQILNPVGRKHEA